eukprot:TRINITY_DN34789_c0_g1_i1.p1 TRINITY_DN34789_c0_g1~~TRINITY_DN34789_c0_g1_i1.p1  ORF type:complete len:545 (+),score=155.10 TRINITY_DN34789_c0_g1_i1:86-1720(+)
MSLAGAASAGPPPWSLRFIAPDVVPPAVQHEMALFPMPRRCGGSSSSSSTSASSRGPLVPNASLVTSAVASGLLLRGCAAAAKGRRAPPKARIVCAAGSAVQPEGDLPSAEELDFLRQVLQDIPALEVLSKAAEGKVLAFASTAQKMHFKTGDYVIRQGELCEGAMYVVSQGELQVQRRRVAEDGSEEMISEPSPAMRGAFFGAPSLLGNTPQEDCLLAKCDVTLWKFQREAFDAIILKDEDDGESSEDEEDMTCGPGSVADLFIVSDSTGQSANSAVRRALKQFEYCKDATCGSSRTTVYRFVRTPDEARKIAKLAKERNAVVVHTVMEQKVYEALDAACQAEGVTQVDLWGNLLKALEDRFGVKRSGIFGRKQVVNEDYLRIIKAIEYTRKVDDGVLPNAWEQCDLMLVGPSRAGKTPLALYLAQQGYKVANYPVVPGEDPPKELFQIDQNKCFALMIKPEKLRSIRMERMAQLKMKDTSYANLAEIKKEVNWIRTFYMQKGPKWPVIDTSEAGVEQTASRIMEILDRRKGDSLAAAYESTD